MSKRDYSHWAEFKIMQLAEEKISEVKKKYFIKWNIIGDVSKEQFDECNKEIQAIYDKYEIQVDREGKILNQNKYKPKTNPYKHGKEK